MPLINNKTISDIQAELDSACGVWGDKFNNMHEASSVIREEFEEFWHEVKQKRQDKEKMRNELKQVAAMCIKAMQQLE